MNEVPCSTWQPAPNHLATKRTETVERAINMLGGRTEVARILNIDPSAVSHWKTAIPFLAGLKLNKYCEDNGIDIYLEDLYPEIYAPNTLNMG